MSHRRDARRSTYFTAVSAALNDRFARRSSESGLDEVLYDPRRLVCTPPPGSDDAEVDPGLLADAQALIRRSLEELGQAAPDSDAPVPADLPGIYRPPPRKEATDPNGPIEPRPPAGRGELRLRIFDLPAGLDASALAEELDGKWTGQCAPVHYALTQQTAQPGEDPEAGHRMDGLPRPGLPASTEDQPGHGISIAVLDTGINEDAITAAGLPHQQLTPDDRDDLRDPTAPSLLGPAAGHGTFIASLITCVAPGAVVRSQLVISSLGLCDEEVIGAAIHDASEAGVQVINLSLGGYPFAGQPGLPTLPAFTVLEAAIAAIPEGIAVVAAAGNAGSPDRFYPAAFDRVIGVAALDTCHNRLWEHSNYGEWVKACTAGVDLRGLFVAGDENPAYDPDKVAESWGDTVNFATWSGTSFAAPLVAAQIAILAAELGISGADAGVKLLNMAKTHLGARPCGKRICVDLPGQT